jgi:hypothetical protein
MISQESKEKRRAYLKSYGLAHREERRAYDNAYYTTHYAADKRSPEEKIIRAARDKIFYSEHREELQARARANYAAHREEYRASAKRYNDAHKEKNRARAKAWRDAHLEHCRALQKVSYIAHREENRAKGKLYYASRKEHYQARGLKRRYGLNPATLNAMIDGQGGLCAICRKPGWGNKRPHVDHDHATGKIRGALCQACNSVLGYARDDAQILRRAADYLDVNA